MKHTGRLAGIVCLFVLALDASSSWAAVTASIDRSRAALGGTLRLTITATDAVDLGDMDLQPLTEDFEILQRSNSSKTSYSGLEGSGIGIIKCPTDVVMATKIIDPRRVGWQAMSMLQGAI